MKAYVYARYSSERQTEQSIEGQLRECYAYAEQNQITVIHDYIDRAISGKTDDRPQFRQMIVDCAKREVEAVIVYKTDRFSRNRYDSAVYKAQLKKYGIRVLYAKEPIPEGIEGILLESLLEGMAEYYSAELSQKVRRGINESALKCKSLGGTVPLGFKIGDDKKYIIDEATAPIVRQIFEMYAKGSTCAEICRKMNALGVKTSRGTPFNKNSLRVMLKNEKYIGIYHVKDVRIEDGVPAIVDRELFDTVQLRIEKNAKEPQHKRAKADYMLSGKLYCGICGKPMTGMSGTSKTGATHNYYRCVGHSHNCPKSTVKKEWLEALVCSETVENVLQPDMIDFIAKKCADLSATDAENNDQSEILKKRLADVEKSIEGILSAMEQGIVTRSTKQRLETLEKQRDTVEQELAQTKAKTPILPEHEIKYILSRFRRETTDVLESYNKDVIDCLVHKTLLSEDKLIVVYNISKDGKSFLQSERLLTPPPPDDTTNNDNTDHSSPTACLSPP